MPGRCNSGNCVQGLFARLKSAARSAARFCRKGTRVPWGSAAPTISSAPRTSTAQPSARPNPWATVAPKLLRPLMRRPTHHRTLARAAVAMLRPTSALTKERSGESLGRTPRQGPAPHGHGIDRTFGAHPREARGRLCGMARFGRAWRDDGTRQSEDRPARWRRTHGVERLHPGRDARARAGPAHCSELANQRVPASRLEITLIAEGDGTRLLLAHTEIPEGQGAQYQEGWVDHYFEPMSAYFTRKKKAPARKARAKKVTKKSAVKKAAVKRRAPKKPVATTATAKKPTAKARKPAGKKTVTNSKRAKRSSTPQLKRGQRGK